ncbi:MAG: hypothetical protein ACOYO1_18755 [Bacteroidales bacterium]
MVKVIYISNNLNLEDLLIANPPSFSIRKDVLAFILNLLTEGLTNYNETSDYSFIPVSSRQLKSITNDYKLYMNYLIQNKVLITNNRYYLNEKSKAYNYTATYQTGIAPYYISDATLIRKIIRRDLANFDKSSKLKHLNKWFNDKLQINDSLAKAQNKKLYQMNLIIDKERAYNKFVHAEMNIEKLKNHKYIFRRDETSFRIHSNITNLNKKFRKFITYDSQSLVSLDIANSQPFLASVLFNINFYDKNYKGLNLYKINHRYYNELIQNRSIFEIRNFLSKINKNSDIHEFVIQSVAGNLYEYMMDVFNSADNNNSFTRNDIKQMLFSVFFSNNHFRKQTKAKYKDLFSQKFPDVYKVFALIKRVNHKRLSIILQTVESYLIIDVLSKKIADHYPDLPIYTIHDSVITLKGHEYKIQALFKKVSLEIIGYFPKINPEFWSLNEE